MDQTDERSAATILSLFDPDRIPPKGLSSSDAVAHYLGPISELPQEAMVVIGLNTLNQPVTTSLVALGTVNSVRVTGRDVFRDLVKHNCAGFILAHNHPSGDTSPSREDDVLTEDSVLMGAVLGIELLDHVIVGEGKHYSYADQGRLPVPRRRFSRA